MFKTIKENSVAEVVEKKSKFIANIFYVETKEEAEEIIKKINKKYHDARHNCYAYRIFCKDTILEKSSDDGEPSGTAGAPILTILSKNNLANVLVIVTRYFGGILLGTGGLVKAYSSACLLGIEKTQIIEKNLAFLYNIELNYTNINNFKYLAKNYDILILKEEYFENPIFQIAIKDKKILNNISEKEINVIKIEYIKEIYV